MNAATCDSSRAWRSRSLAPPPLTATIPFGYLGGDTFADTLVRASYI